jgi:hypothetical protein
LMNLVLKNKVNHFKQIGTGSLYCTNNSVFCSVCKFQGDSKSGIICFVLLKIMIHHSIQNFWELMWWSISEFSGWSWSNLMWGYRNDRTSKCDSSFFWVQFPSFYEGSNIIFWFWKYFNFGRSSACSNFSARCSMANMSFQ